MMKACCSRSPTNRNNHDTKSPTTRTPQKHHYTQAMYARPIKLGASKAATPHQMAVGDARKRRLTALLRRDFLLRRDKTQPGVAEQLPRKVDAIVFCELRPAQKRAYARLVASPDLQLLARASEECDCGSALPRAQCCHTEARPEDGGVLWPHYHLCDCRDPSCRNHKPHGCEEYYAAAGGRAVLKCPYCLLFPALKLVQRAANHLDLLRPDAARADDPDPRTRRQVCVWGAGQRRKEEKSVWRRMLCARETDSAPAALHIHIQNTHTHTRTKHSTRLTMRSRSSRSATTPTSSAASPRAGSRGST